MLDLLVLLPIADARDFQTSITRKEYFHVHVIQSCAVFHGQDTSPPLGICTGYILVFELPGYVDPHSVKVAGVNCDSRDLGAGRSFVE